MSIKTETRNAARKIALDKILNGVNELTAVRVGNTNAYDLYTGMNDPETGKPLYALVTVVVKDPVGSENIAPYDHDAAVTAYEQYLTDVQARESEKAKSSKGMSEKDRARKEAAAKEREAIMNAVTAYFAANPDEVKTTSELCAEVPGLEHVSPLTAGKVLKLMSDPNSESPVLTCVMEGKTKTYTLAKN